jgi:hypothetical protein
MRKSWTITREVLANKLGSIIIYPNLEFCLISRSPCKITLKQNMTATYRIVQRYSYRSSTIICSLYSAINVYAIWSWGSIDKYPKNQSKILLSGTSMFSVNFAEFFTEASANFYHNLHLANEIYHILWRVSLTTNIVEEISLFLF